MNSLDSLFIMNADEISPNCESRQDSECQAITPLESKETSNLTLESKDNEQELHETSFQSNNSKEDKCLVRPMSSGTSSYSEDFGSILATAGSKSETINLDLEIHLLPTGKACKCHCHTHSQGSKSKIKKPKHDSRRMQRSSIFNSSDEVNLLKKESFESSNAAGLMAKNDSKPYNSKSKMPAQQIVKDSVQKFPGGVTKIREISKIFPPFKISQKDRINQSSDAKEILEANNLKSTPNGTINGQLVSNDLIDCISKPVIPNKLFSTDQNNKVTNSQLSSQPSEFKAENFQKGPLQIKIQTTPSISYGGQSKHSIEASTNNPFVEFIRYKPTSEAADIRVPEEMKDGLKNKIGSIERALHENDKKIKDVQEKLNNLLIRDRIRLKNDGSIESKLSSRSLDSVPSDFTKTESSGTLRATQESTSLSEKSSSRCRHGRHSRQELSGTGDKISLEGEDSQLAFEINADNYSSTSEESGYSSLLNYVNASKPVIRNTPKDLSWRVEVSSKLQPQTSKENSREEGHGKSRESYTSDSSLNGSSSISMRVASDGNVDHSSSTNEETYKSKESLYSDRSIYIEVPKSSTRNTPRGVNWKDETFLNIKQTLDESRRDEYNGKSHGPCSSDYIVDASPRRLMSATKYETKINKECGYADHSNHVNASKSSNQNTPRGVNWRDVSFTRQTSKENRSGEYDGESRESYNSNKVKDRSSGRPMCAASVNNRSPTNDKTYRSEKSGYTDHSNNTNVSKSFTPDMHSLLNKTEQKATKN